MPSDGYIAWCARLWRSDGGHCSSATSCTGALTRGVKLALTFHLALVRCRTLPLRRFPSVKRLAGLGFGRSLVWHGRQHPGTPWHAGARTGTRRYRTTALLKGSCWLATRASAGSATAWTGRKRPSLTARLQRSHRLTRSGSTLTLMTARSRARDRAAIATCGHGWPRRRSSRSRAGSSGSGTRTCCCRASANGLTRWWLPRALRLQRSLTRDGGRSPRPRCGTRGCGRRRTQRCAGLRSRRHNGACRRRRCRRHGSFGRRRRRNGWRLCLRCDSCWCRRDWASRRRCYRSWRSGSDGHRGRWRCHDSCRSGGRRSRSWCCWGRRRR
jgi:hypothetical protein